MACADREVGEAVRCTAERKDSGVATTSIGPLDRRKEGVARHHFTGDPYPLRLYIERRTAID